MVHRFEGYGKREIFRTSCVAVNEMKSTNYKTTLDDTSGCGWNRAQFSLFAVNVYRAQCLSQLRDYYFYGPTALLRFPIAYAVSRAHWTGD
jgi:hypothetical protein